MGRSNRKNQKKRKRKLQTTRRGGSEGGNSPDLCENLNKGERRYSFSGVGRNPLACGDVAYATEDSRIDWTPDGCCNLRFLSTSKKMDGKGETDRR
jgi:hypothetical protein